MMVELLNISNIKLPSINTKYFNRSFVLSKKYRKFKEDISLLCTNHIIKPPQRVHIFAETYLDIDNFIKPILDGLELCFSNDRNIQELYVNKLPIKRGKSGAIRVYAETISK